MHCSQWLVNCICLALRWLLLLLQREKTKNPHHTALTHIFIFPCWVNNTAFSVNQEQLILMGKQLREAASQNQQRGKFSAISDCVAWFSRVLGLWPCFNSTSLTDNNALGLRREVSQLRTQLATCSAAASAITGCKHPSTPSLSMLMTLCKKTKHVESFLESPPQPIIPSYKARCLSSWTRLTVTLLMVSPPKQGSLCHSYCLVTFCVTLVGQMWVFLSSSKGHRTHQRREHIRKEAESCC